jgi:hypothetical protein
VKTPHTSTVDLTADIAKAQQELERPARDVAGALQLWTCLTAAHRMAAAYVEDLDQLRYEAKMAYTKAVVIEYWKPWSDNRNNPGLQSAANSNELNHLTQTHMHKVLRELRNCVIAHADEAYEGRGITLLGTPVVNDRPELHPRTLPATFVPVKLSVGSSRSLWWLKDGARLAEMRDHIQRCNEAATQRIHVAARYLLKVCLDHIHVLEHVDLFTLEPLEVTSLRQVRVPDSGQTRELPELSQPIALKVGDEHVQSLVTVYSPSAYIPQVEVRGDGFILKVFPGQDTTSLRFTVSFPSRRPIQPEARG